MIIETMQRFRGPLSLVRVELSHALVKLGNFTAAREVCEKDIRSKGYNVQQGQCSSGGDGEEEEEEQEEEEDDDDDVVDGDDGIF